MSGWFTGDYSDLGRFYSDKSVTVLPNRYMHGLRPWVNLQIVGTGATAASVAAPILLVVIAIVVYATCVYKCKFTLVKRLFTNVHVYLQM